jgi:hypothetical protein
MDIILENDVINYTTQKILKFISVVYLTKSANYDQIFGKKKNLFFRILSDPLNRRIIYEYLCKNNGGDVNYNWVCVKALQLTRPVRRHMAEYHLFTGVTHFLEKYTFEYMDLYTSFITSDAV